jgi:hypothetical protein
VRRIAALAVAAALAAPLAAAGGKPRALVSYSRTGGFIGVNDALVVYRDGSADSTNGPIRLSARARLRLQASLRSARFATLRRAYAPAQPVADGFTYRVGYAGRHVRVEEGAKPPLRLQRVLDLLAAILASGG